MSAELGSTKDYRFFLSYSRRDAIGQGKAENAWFKRFRDDLLVDVAREAKLPASVASEDVGFYDRLGIQTGVRWSDALSEGLQASRTLVCLYSPNYFNSQYCGKEFQVFSERVTEYERQKRVRPTNIIPIHWDAPNKLQPLPASAASLQLDDLSLGALYAERGLMYLLRMQEEAAYQQFLLAIAAKIADAAKLALPRIHSQSLDKIESAFHTSPTKSPPSDAPTLKGVKAAWLVYVAGTQAEYESVRTKRSCYGSNGSEWQPFLPDAESLVGAIASNVISGNNLSPAPLAVTEKLLDHLQEAEDNNTMAVIIVDPWSIRIKSYEAAMIDLDRARLTNSGVIVLQNQNDPETKAQQAALEALLRTTFSRTWTSKDVYFQHSVQSEQQLREVLTAAIEEVRRRIADRGRLLRGDVPISDEPFPKLPTAGSSATAAAAGVQ